MPPSDDARRAGRGGVAVLGAKVFFVLSGLVQQTLLPRVIGLAGYGALALVLAPANILNNVVIASSTQGSSRVVARSLRHEREAVRSAFGVHVPIAVGLALVFAALSPVVAKFEGAPGIVTPIAIMGLVVLAYGLYGPIIGILNGRGEFTRQAGLDVTFAILRTGGMLGLGWLFLGRSASGTLGATLGVVMAATLIVPLAVRVALPLRAADETAPPPPLLKSAYLAELWPLALAQFFTNAVMQADIMLLGHFLAAKNGGDTVASEEWVGVYRACQLFAFLPYQLLLSVTQILFPMLARAKAEGDSARVRTYVERGARLAALGCGLMVAVIVAAPESVIRFAYRPEVAERGAHALRILVLGQGAYTMLAIATTILASLGHERIGARISFGALVAMVTACSLLTPRASFGGAQLEASALGTSLGLALLLTVATVQVRKIAGGFVPALTAVRALLALGVAATVGSFIPPGGPVMTIATALIVAGVYLVTLVVLRELRAEDAHALRALRG